MCTGLKVDMKKQITVRPMIYKDGKFVAEEPVTMFVDEELLKPDPNFNWCKCEDPDFGRFCKDGTCEDCYKHHYHCSHCDGIMQIG